MNEKDIAKAYMEFESSLNQLINEAKIPYICKVMAVKSAANSLQANLNNLLRTVDPVPEEPKEN